MKKIIFSTLLALSISTSASLAKTEGSYVGLDAIGTFTRTESKANLSSDSSLHKWYNHTKNDSDYGLGVSYKYAFNFDKFFIAPGVSYNLLNAQSKAAYSGSNNDPFYQNIKLKDQISAQLNLGYDLTDKFAVYVPFGLSSFSYEYRTSDNGGSSGSINTRKTGRENSAFIGLGASFYPAKNWALNLEYNRFEKLDVRSNSATFNNSRIDAKIAVDMLKFGVAYNF